MLRKIYSWLGFLEKPFIILISVLLIVSAFCGCETSNNEKKDETTKNIINLSGQTELASSITYSNTVKNNVQGYFDSSTYENGSYVVQNTSCSFSHILKGTSKIVEYFKNASGNSYLVNTMDVYLINDGDKQYAKKSSLDARINTVDLGYYYYTVNVRDMTFDGVPCYLEKIYHTYPDKVNEEFRFVSQGNMSDVTAFGFEVKVNKETVSSLEVYDGVNTVSSVTGFDKKTVQYIALDIKDAGVIGFIMSDNEYSLTIVETSKYYVISQEVSVVGSSLSSGEDYSFGNRIYNDETHSFDGIRNANKVEQNPLAAENFEVENQDDAKYVGYDNLKGCYEFYLTGESFYTAYYVQPEKKFLEHVKITGDDLDRVIYCYVHTDYPLEGAALLDENSVQVPVPVQVSKNFGHEKEEPIYDPLDTIYGDSYFPIVIEKNAEKEFTLVNVYSNWGNYEIKQLSSISYYVSYYHLSTGVHETNCIAPYYALKGPSLNYGSFNKSWFLPDFRGLSGDIWEVDPQYNSAGMLMSVNSDYGYTLCNYLGSDIHSSGLTYADMDYSFISADGAFKYTMRHVEMPQNDESRTYYELSIEFLKDISYEKGSLSLVSFNGRNCTYKYSTYLGENGEEKTINNPTRSIDTPNIYTLNSGSSYFSLVGINEDDTQDQNNFGCIIKNYNIKVNGSDSNVSLAYLNDWRENLNYASLTLSEDVSFKKGDTIDASLIFMSYGKVGQTDIDNVRMVYNDSVVNNITTTVFTGTQIEDEYIPTIKAKNNVAQFSLSGGVYQDNEVNYTVKVSGVTKLGRPKISRYVNGEWVTYDYASDAGYDGYSVIYEDDALTYSFVFTQNSNGNIFKFEIN